MDRKTKLPDQLDEILPNKDGEHDQVVNKASVFFAALVLGIAIFAFASTKRIDDAEKTNISLLDEKFTAAECDHNTRPSTSLHSIFRSPWFLAFLLALLSSALDVALGFFPVISRAKVGGYLEALSGDHHGKSSVVLLDQTKYLSNPSNEDPRKATEVAEWNRVIENWKNTERVVNALHDAGAKAVVLDYELALTDHYISLREVKSKDGYFNDDAIPGPAKNEYCSLLKTLVRINGLGTKVVFAADNLEERVSDSNSEYIQEPFPIKGANELAAFAIAPDGALGDYLATSNARKNLSHGYPSMSDAVASTQGDKLGQSILPGFSTYAVELEEESEHRQKVESKILEETGWRQFWVDFQLVSETPVDYIDGSDFIEAVKGKVVVVGDQKYGTGDNFTLPGKGIKPGYFHLASAIATRTSNPIYAPESPLVEGIYLFVISYALSVIALGSAHAISYFRHYKHGSIGALRSDFICDAVILLLTISFFVWLAKNLAFHRMLLPMLPLVLIVRFLELFFLWWYTIVKRSEYENA